VAVRVENVSGIGSCLSPALPTVDTSMRLATQRDQRPSTLATAMPHSGPWIRDPGLSIVANFLFMPAYPVWALTIIRH
jgi:hypothetical protein